MDLSVDYQHRGLPLGKLNYWLAAITLLISAFLIYETFRISNGYAQLSRATENYIAWEQSASNIKESTDFLTEQARNFIMTGERAYLDRYFMEVNVTRRRESALEELGKTLDGTDAYARLGDILDQSRALMSREYYAMRLTISAFGYELSDFPKELQSTTLLAKDARLSRGEKLERAQSMVLDSEYLEKKAAIDEDMRVIFSSLVNGVREEQMQASQGMQRLLTVQRLLIFILILIIAVIVTLTSFLVINPLLRGVLRIRTEQPLPIIGSYEFQFLAKTYNLMFETNRQKTEELAFEASHDKLTGLYNRAGYDFLMKHTDLTSCALLLIDVDKFKGVNDTYGHDMGDRVLANIAEVLRDSFRSEDHVCRIGGDEFAAIMIHVGPQFTDMIRAKVERINQKLLNPSAGLAPVSVSVGVAFYNSEHSTGNLIKDADVALYRVKEMGRCGVAFYEQCLPEAAQTPAQS